MVEKKEFDAPSFVNKVILVLFLLLLIFGSTKLEGLTVAEDIVGPL